MLLATGPDTCAHGGWLMLHRDIHCGPDKKPGVGTAEDRQVVFSDPLKRAGLGLLSRAFWSFGVLHPMSHYCRHVSPKDPCAK